MQIYAVRVIKCETLITNIRASANNTCATSASIEIYDFESKTIKFT